MKTQTRIASLLTLTILCLLLAVAPAMADTLYSNGPYDGNTAAWTINLGFAVSDSATVPNGSTITGLDFVYWDTSSTDILTTVDMSIGSTPFGNDIFSGTLTDVTNTFLGTNQFGYQLLEAACKGTHIPPPPIVLYVTLSNACTTGGCSENPIYWDENSGPSSAFENTLGSIPSEAFTLIGTSGTTPEPSSITLFGSGILVLAGILRRRLMG
jgi:PEP-CTERM motif